jgi:hypothetical protein
MDQTYDERHPLPELSGLVRTVWIQRTGSGPYPQRNLPTGGVELHCPVGGVPRLIGPLTQAQLQVIPPRTTIVGVRFMPGAGTALIGVPAYELVDCVVELWGPAAIAIGSIVASASPSDALLGVQRYLARQRLRPDPVVAEMVRRLMPWDRTGIATLADDLALSESQLRRRCLASVGVSPNAFGRIWATVGIVGLTLGGGLGLLRR